MGLWPFGKAKADVESTSRVIVFRARDGVALRGKVTVRLEEPQTQEEADKTLEQCAEIARAIIREAPTGQDVVGCESALSAETVARLTKEITLVRAVEIAALHIVGQQAHATRAATEDKSHPAWLHHSPPPSSDKLPPEKTFDRPTPIKPIPAVQIHTAAKKAPPANARAIENAASNGLPTPPANVLNTTAKAGLNPTVSGESKPTDPAVSTKPARRHIPPDKFAVRPTAPSLTRPEDPPPAPGSPARVHIEETHSKAAEPPPPAADHGPSSPHAHNMHSNPARVTKPAVAATHVSPRHAQHPPPHDVHPKRFDPRAEEDSPPASSPPQAARRPSSLPPRQPEGGFGTHARYISSAPPARMTPPPGAVHTPKITPPPGAVRAPSRFPPAEDEPAHSTRRFGSAPPPSTGPRSAPPPSVGPHSRASHRPPPAAIAARRRVVAAKLPLPNNAGPYEVARGLTPLFRDTAGRILVAFLRAYDLTVVRRVPFDAIESDILASLTAPSDGAPGAYVASHAPEIQRWRDALGAPKMEKLEREANLAAAALAFEGLAAEGVSQRNADAVVEGLAGSAFGDPDLIIDLGRYLYPANETTHAETLANMITVAGEDMPPGLENALEPLFASLREDVAAAAQIAKEVMI